jgi:predicted nuclease with TOPRIM domain
MAKRVTRVTLTLLDRKIDGSVDRLGKRSDRLDKKFDGLDAKFDRLDGKFVRLERKVDRLDYKIGVTSDEGKRHASALFEQTREEIQKVAEGVAALNEKVGALVDRVPRTTDDIDLLKLGYRNLDRPVTHLEEASPSPRRP